MQNFLVRASFLTDMETLDLKREKNISRGLTRKTRIYFDIFDLSAFICVYPRLKIAFITFCWGITLNLYFQSIKLSGF
jgi:hypothetical protein